jgi:hypothetical protein
VASLTTPPFCIVSCLATASSTAGMRAGTIRAWQTSSVITARLGAWIQVGTTCGASYVDSCTGAMRYMVICPLHPAACLWRDRVQRD